MATTARRQLLDRHHTSRAATSLHRAGFHHARLHAMADFAIRNGAGGRVWLDVGCGSGKFLSLLDTDGEGLHIGVDLSMAALTLGLQSHSNVHFLLTSWSHLPLASQSCDVLSCLEILGHLSPTERIAAIAESCRSLKPNGWLLIAIKMGPNPALVLEEELHQLLQGRFRIVARLPYDSTFHTRTSQRLTPVIDLFGYYADLLHNINGTAPVASPPLGRLLRISSKYFPWTIRLGAKLFVLLLALAESPITSRWVGFLHWQRGLRRAKHHPTGLALLCRKIETPPCNPSLG